MKTTENLLVTAMEECAEVQQAISKVLRFGADSRNPYAPERTNGENVMIEFYHLSAMIAMLQSEGILPIISTYEARKIAKEKAIKVCKHLEISRKAGTVNDDL